MKLYTDNSPNVVKMAVNGIPTGQWNVTEDERKIKDNNWRRKKDQWLQPNFVLSMAWQHGYTWSDSLQVKFSQDLIIITVTMILQLTKLTSTGDANT